MWDFSDTPSEDMNLKEKEEKHVLSVSEAIIVIKENITRIPLLTVVGEVSGFRGPNARSGHCYLISKTQVRAWRQSCGRASILQAGLLFTMA